MRQITPASSSSISLLLFFLAWPFGESFVSKLISKSRRSSSLFYDEKDSSSQDALERTAAHLEKLRRLNRKKGLSNHNDYDNNNNNVKGGDEAMELLKRDYLMQSANTLKNELKLRKLSQTGRKPDLAQRLAEDEFLKQHKALEKNNIVVHKEEEYEETLVPLSQFAGVSVSGAAGLALRRAGFHRPTPIQAAAIPLLLQGDGSCVLHAETGSGKSLAYLLPITEYFWKASARQQPNNQRRALILTPTRELAAQVAGVASALAPPGAVRLIAHPTNLCSASVKDRGEFEFGGRGDAVGVPPCIFIGSAKAVMHSLYGDGIMPASPTPKPLAMDFLQSVSWLVLDEVDRLLNVKKSHSDKVYKKIHERPAAVLSAAVERSTLGKVRVVAVSATVGRSLKRELARVLGLLPHECPPVVTAQAGNTSQDLDEEVIVAKDQQHSRAVTIPATVKHYLLGVDGSSDGKLLTGAYTLIQELTKSNKGTQKRILMVLAKSFGINTQNTIGALKHFQCNVDPKSLLDVLEAEGTDQMIEVHRQVSRSSGIGESALSSSLVQSENDGYFLVTGEDTVRGLHLDGLDMVIIVGRPNGPDEYTHIAGRTGRAGRHGKVISILSQENVLTLKSWARMLNVIFHTMDSKNLAAAVSELD